MSGRRPDMGWKFDEQQGLPSPLGSEPFISHKLRAKRAAQDCLLEASAVLEAAWLLLRYYTAPHA